MRNQGPCLHSGCKAAVHAVLACSMVSMAWDKHISLNQPNHFLSSLGAVYPKGSAAIHSISHRSNPDPDSSDRQIVSINENVSISFRRHDLLENQLCTGLKRSLAYETIFRVLQLRGAGDEDGKPGSSELEDEYLLSGLDDVDPEDGVTSSLPDEALM